jgi:hypothetical protein
MEAARTASAKTGARAARRSTASVTQRYAVVVPTLEPDRELGIRMAVAEMNKVRRAWRPALRRRQRLPSSRRR